MQVDHRELYRFGLRMPYVQCEIGVCIALHPRVLVVGGYKQVTREG